MVNSQLPSIEQMLNYQLTSILLLDSSLTICYANLAAQQLLSQSARKLIGMTLPDLVNNNINYIPLNIEQMRSSLNDGQSFTDNEVTLVTDTHAHTLSLTAQPINDGYILLELCGQDNRRRLSQEQQQQAQQSAERELIRSLAHEIKNPLGGLRGAAQLLAKALPDTSLQEYTTMIIEQADRLRNLVDRLLGPQRPGERINQSIHQVVERVYQLLVLEKAENVVVLRDYDPSLPEFDHDPEQIEQVLLNIGRNALQALQVRQTSQTQQAQQTLDKHGGSITLRTRTAFQTTLHGERYRLAARIDIEDNGAGIPAHLQDTLFYPMVSGREGGTGFGLSIARSLVYQHRGKIEFNSWPGHTEFSVYLPIRQ